MSDDFLLGCIDYNVIIYYNNNESIIPLYDLFVIFPIECENCLLHRALERAVVELNYMTYEDDRSKRVILNMISGIMYNYTGIRIKILKLK